MRFTVADDATGLATDVVVECAPSDPVRVVLDHIGSVLAVRGAPSVDGLVLDADADAAVAASPLCEGAVLRYGTPGRAASPHDTMVVRVLSGPSAGGQLRLGPGPPVSVGRGSECGLVLDDPDVSRLHATVEVAAAGVVLRDQDSSNGTLVEGRVVDGPHPWRDGEIVQLGGTRLVLEAGSRSRAVLERSPDGAFLLNRRFPDRREPFVAPTVQLPAAPVHEEGRGLPLIAMIMPAVLAVVLAFVLRAPVYLLFGLMSPVMLAGNWWTDRRRRGRREQREGGSYAAALRAATAQVEQSVAEEDADRHARLPDPRMVERIALVPRVELWSRRPGDGSWLTLRLGTADRSAAVDVRGDRPPGWTEPGLRRAPAGIDLDAVGVLGVAGSPAWLADRLAWVLTQCAVLHSPDELQIVVLAPDADEAELGWVRWLPHVRDGSGTVLAGWDETGVEQVTRMLTGELGRRVEQDGRRLPTGRRILVVLAGAGSLSRRPAVVDLLARGPALGIRAICADTDDRLLPDRCGAVLVSNGHRTELRIDRGERIAVTDDVLSAGAVERIARRLAPLRRVGDAPAGGLPTTVRFVDAGGAPGVDDVRAAWRMRPGRTDVIIGREANGPAVLDIARDGPHAIVAGTTGAGKSELLRTWVAALALNNTPEHLSIVFVDYKGGSAFQELVPLPHVVGSVTNLDARAARRALASLRAELRRRQEQLATAEVTDRATYLQKAATDPTLRPFPRLLVVVDELAEMKEQLPDMVEGLVGVARIGRSLGVHLVLATQKPAGVVDGQIRANSALRVCLRTADPGESMDVIETGSAADIPADRPGRALIVRGGGAPVAVQTARVTTPCGPGNGVRRRVVPLHWADLAAPPVRDQEADSLRTDLTDVVESVRAAAAAEGLVAPFRPWHEPLPPVVALGTLLDTPLAITVGLRDEPDLQRQDVLHLPLGTGHLAVVGSGRTGRTTALRAIAAGLARANGPESVHIHVVDASGGLAGLSALPHVGVITGPDDPERLERLLTRLAEEVRERRRRLTERGAANLDELRARGEMRAHVVLLVDGWSGAVEGTDAGAPAALQELLGGGSAAAGLTVCIAGDERLLKSRVLGRIDHRLCLRLNNPSDGMLLGLDVRSTPDGLAAGRGMWAADGCEVQVPLLSPDMAGLAQAEALAALGAGLRERFPDPGTRGPLRLDPLPGRIGVAAASGLGPVPTGRLPVLLGVAGDRLAPVWVDLADGAGHLVVAGPSRSGRSTALASMAASAARTAAVVLVSARPGSAHRAAAGHGVVVVAPAGLPDVLDTGVGLVLVDDAGAGVWDDALVARLAGPGGPALGVAAEPDAFGYGARGLVQAVRKAVGPVVLLSPPDTMSADTLGIRIGRGALFNGPPGRALLAVEGELWTGQVPDVTVD